MRDTHEAQAITRRVWIRTSTMFAGGLALAHGWPWLRASAEAWAPSDLALQSAAPPEDAAARMRAQIAKSPIATLALGSNLTMLSGPGGNIVVLHGKDGKIVVDTFVQTVWPQLKNALDGMGPGPLRTVIDTHWHFDHSDSNANFREAGAEVVAHDNTRTRMSQTHDLLGMHFEPSPPAALPTRTFAATDTLQANGESVELGYIPPAHTDTDIYVRYAGGNVLHLGDVFFNGMYPFIDATTGGSINGMIAGADKGLDLSDNQTKVVPGHGPLGDKAALTRYRDMLVTVRDRVQRLKTSGRSLDEVVAQKPTADLDATWGKGSTRPENFVTLVYNLL
ncbi:MAG: MBL fold metallo-hydrolase [Acidobacteria bacterium]|nr:MBL fold metallo-hydrolase [Acidobacteriota bacterium]